VRTPFSTRSTHLTGHRLTTAAALLAAHAASERDGFAPSDVRFFVRLFENWLERDVRFPGEDVDLTQLRRGIDKLVKDRWARTQDLGGTTRTKRHRLTHEGIVGLAELVADPSTHRSLDEALFAFTFATTYGDAIIHRLSSARLDARRETLPTDVRRRLRRVLDPRAILSGAKAELQRARVDLQRRIHEGRELLDIIARGRRQAWNDETILERLEAKSPYQLQPVRAMRDLFHALPAELRRLELDTGIEARIDGIFVPLAKRIDAEILVLDAVARRFAER
jgi:hypothetical protein